jgi:hypothetical protein
MSFGGVEDAFEICQIFEVGYHIRRILVCKLTQKIFFAVTKKILSCGGVRKKSFLAFFGGEELSLYFQKTKKQHNIYHMIPCRRQEKTR